VLTVRSPFEECQDVGIFTADAWRVADLGTKHALLLAGIGWGNMPEPSVRGRSGLGAPGTVRAYGWACPILFSDGAKIVFVGAPINTVADI
jgi:hypothetical protein